MTGKALDTIVIGGGLHGLSAALHLARAGRKVIILERSWVGRHSSGGTAAGVRTLNRDPAELPISLEAMDMWHRIETIVGDDCGFHANGQIEVAEFEHHLPEIEQRYAMTRAAGYENEELIERAELRRLVPALAPHCVGAIIARRDGAADPHRTLRAFRQATEAAGVMIYEGAGVTSVEPVGGNWRVRTETQDFVAPTVINAAGAWADKIATMVGDNVEVGHKASMMIVTERVAPLLKPVVGVVGRPLSFKQSDQGTLVIGGGLQGRADLEAQRSFVDYKELSRGAKAATDLFPAVRQVRIVRTWAGMESTPKDKLPVLCASPNATGVFHSFGYSGHGFQLVPVCGAIIADLVIHGGTNRSIEAFNVERLFKRSEAA
ncbi:FAD-binding oxidoreductase [Rhizobium rhizogenes]|uniref:NAD(P)/FAD-dependent oxidoreductase n=1 Tax=Rhizobium rhizogenes TaxID=359 RepID=UPI0022B6EFFD|nr:FAD-dependent oxidoreductase [Rhizobium rhizogenes]MCZ7448261.1 FAD-dependent oxidoreductase [Rhizobium rhizogenes]MCZ7465694.1 FAD-dependent oxidoreductase [Rhizobium rhizogenes]